MTLPRDHYINLKNGGFDSTSKAELDALFGSFSTDQHRNTLVVHFHGGLVSEAVGMGIAERLLPVYRAAGAYPVFFVWESGLREVLTHNLGEIAQEKAFQRLLTRITQFAVAKFTQSPGSRGAGRLELPFESAVEAELSKSDLGQEPYANLSRLSLPGAEALNDQEQQQLRDELEMDQELTEEAGKIANTFRPVQEMAEADVSTRGTRVRGSTRTLMSPSVMEQIRREQDSTGRDRGLLTTAFLVKGAVAVLQRVIARFVGRRDHGLHATIVEELLREFYLANAGAVVWSLMKQDTADAFKGDPQRHGGTAFLEGLKAHWLGGGRPRIVLIGHSTGAVFICQLLQHAEAALPSDMAFDVVFLAPACTFKLFSDTLQASQHRIHDMRLFTMRDDLERTDRLVPGLYPRSLLYFVSGAVEDEADMPVVGMQRFFSGGPPFDAASYPDVEAVRRFLQQKPGRVVWSVEASGSGRVSRASRHTDFDDERDTLESLSHIIAHGL